MTQVATRLEYAPAPPRRRRLLRRGILLLVLVAAGVAAWRWGPTAYRQGALLYWQRRCLTYTASADQVVYEEEPAEAAKLLARGPQYSAYPLSRRVESGAALKVNAAVYTPTCWGRFLRSVPVLTVRGAISCPVIFLHEMRSAGGNRFLVGVEYAPEADTFVAQPIEGYNYSAGVFVPATPFSPARPIANPIAIDVLSGWSAPPHVRMYAGQVDPTDPSHFTVKYQMWGQSDVMDGRIDDQGRVSLKQRTPPQRPSR